MNDHHAACCAFAADCSCVIIPWSRLSSFNFYLSPLEWRDFCIEGPKVIYWPCTSIATKYDNLWFDVDHCMPIPSSWSLAYDWNSHPMGRVFSGSSIKQVEVIAGESASAFGSSKDYHLIFFDLGACVSCSRRWQYSRSWEIQFLPFIAYHVKAISVIRNHLLTSSLSSSPTK